jgi:hypothetical protein
MSDYQDEPNQEGFGGDPTTPEPEPDPERRPGGVDGEAIAVPDSDLVRPVAEALEPQRSDDD